MFLKNFVNSIKIDGDTAV